MNYRVSITNTAKQDLREIAFYFADRAMDKGIAKQFVKELGDACKRLENFPNTGALPKDRILLSAGYRYIEFKDYLIFYTVQEKMAEVDVHAIFHTKKDYMRVMRRFT